MAVGVLFPLSQAEGDLLVLTMSPKVAMGPPLAQCEEGAESWYRESGKPNQNHNETPPHASQNG